MMIQNKLKNFKFVVWSISTLGQVLGKIQATQFFEDSQKLLIMSFDIYWRNLSGL